MGQNKVIVTGGTGYIGSNVVRYMLAQGWSIYLVVDPLFGYNNISDFIDEIEIFEYPQGTNISCLIDFFKRVNADVVFHLAAAVITNYKTSDIANLIQSNIQFGTEILEAMSQSSTNMLVNTGTYWQNYNTNGYNPVDLYAATKEAFEAISQYYVDANNLSVLTLKLYDVYGENDIRPKLLNLLKKCIEEGNDLDLSPGEQFVDMVHVSDVCEAYFSAYEYIKSKNINFRETFAVATGRLVSVKDLVELFIDLSQATIKINIGKRPYKDREIMRPLMIQTLPNWEAKIDLAQGLKRFLQK